MIDKLLKKIEKNSKGYLVAVILLLSTISLSYIFILYHNKGSNFDGIKGELNEEEILILDELQKSERVGVIVRLIETTESYEKTIQNISDSIPRGDMQLTGILTRGFAANITLNGFKMLRDNLNVKSIVLDKQISIINSH